jgi:hypothetical protein
VRLLDIGSPLMIEKSSISYPGHVKSEYLWSSRNNQWSHLDSLFAPSVAYSAWMSDIYNGKSIPVPLEIGTSIVSLKSLGATAIAKSLPDVPDFSLARFIGELRAGLPKVPLNELRKSQRKVSTLGSEYLNVQFGLLPTISDVSKLITLAGHPELRARVKHTLGQETRVKKTLLKETSTSTRSLTLTEMTTLPVAFASNQRGTQTITDAKKIWSSVSFTYFQANRLLTLLDDLDEQLGNYGSIPRLIDAWNLTAWSWFIDWFTNFNHVLTNLSYLGRDGLTIQRGYLMCTHERRVETFQSAFIKGSGTASSRGIANFSRKYRVTASPFGFGYTWTDFSPFQTSILAALGVNRLRF